MIHHLFCAYYAVHVEMDPIDYIASFHRVALLVPLVRQIEWKFDGDYVKRIAGTKRNDSERRKREKFGGRIFWNGARVWKQCTYVFCMISVRIASLGVDDAWVGSFRSRNLLCNSVKDNDWSVTHDFARCVRHVGAMGTRTGLRSLLFSPLGEKMTEGY